MEDAARFCRRVLFLFLFLFFVIGCMMMKTGPVAAEGEGYLPGPPQGLTVVKQEIPTPVPLEVLYPGAVVVEAFAESGVSMEVMYLTCTCFLIPLNSLGGLLGNFYERALDNIHNMLICTAGLCSQI
jgi:hypothetical protein